MVKVGFRDAGLRDLGFRDLGLRVYSPRHLRVQGLGEVRIVAEKMGNDRDRQKEWGDYIETGLPHGFMRA